MTFMPLVGERSLQLAVAREERLATGQLPVSERLYHAGEALRQSRYAHAHASSGLVNCQA
jgi:hypothetical protein